MRDYFEGACEARYIYQGKSWSYSLTFALAQVAEAWGISTAKAFEMLKELDAQIVEPEDRIGCRRRN